MGAIRDAIVLTDPWLYWPLDDGVLSDIGSNSHGLSSLGDVDLTYTGLEKGLTCARLTAGASISSDPLGISTLTDFTMACYVAVAPTGAWNTWRALATLGNPGATAGVSRGGALGLNGVAAGAPTTEGQWYPTAVFAAGPAAVQPVYFWHHHAMVFQASSRLVTCYYDGSSATGTAMNFATMGAIAPGDRLMVTFPSNITFMHMAIWRGALSVAQIGAIGGFATQWPPNMVIQVAGGGGGGGTGGTVTIGEPQATQITNIETHTNDIPGITDAVNFISDTVNHIKGVTDQVLTDTTNIVNTLFPQLATVLNDIGAQLNDLQNAVRGTVKQGTETLQKTVGELLSRGNATDLDYASLSGGPTCSPINLDVSGNHLYGIRLEITAYPPEWQFRTPDLAWSLKDLAVIRVYRQGKLQARQGVHTIVHTWEPIPQPGYPFLGIFPPVQTPGTVITVDFAPGVCGELIGIEFPS